MPAPKPKSEHRTPLPVTCSIKQKRQIDEILEAASPIPRSRYILELLENAMRLKYSEFSRESYSHNTTVEFQISCTPQEKERILNFCYNYLPSKKRSRWIVEVILSNKP